MATIEGGCHGDGSSHVNRIDMGLAEHNFSLLFKAFIMLHSVAHTKKDRSTYLKKEILDPEREVQTLLPFSTRA